MASRRAKRSVNTSMETESKANLTLLSIDIPFPTTASSPQEKTNPSQNPNTHRYITNDHSLFKNEIRDDLIKFRIQYIDTSLDIFENMHDLGYTPIQFKIPILRLLII